MLSTECTIADVMEVFTTWVVIKRAAKGGRVLADIALEVGVHPDGTTESFLTLGQVAKRYDDWYAPLFQWDPDAGLVPKKGVVEKGLLISRAHFQLFWKLGSDGQAEAINIYNQHYRLDHVGTVPMAVSGTRDRDKLSAFVRDILPFTAITRDGIRILNESSHLFRERNGVAKHVLGKLDGILRKYDQLMRNLESKSRCKEANKRDGGTYQSLTVGSIKQILEHSREVYHSLRSKDPSLPSVPVFLDSGGGLGRPALLAAAENAWITITIEIYQLKGYIAADSAQAVFAYPYFKNLQTAFFCHDASAPDNWNGVQIAMIWDCAFTREVYNGMIDNLARTSDNHPVILITSCRWWNDSVERQVWGNTRKEYLKERFEELSEGENCRRKTKGKAFKVMMTGGCGSDTVYFWVLKKRHSPKTKELVTLDYRPSIVDRAKDQLGRFSEEKRKNIGAQFSKLSSKEETGGRGCRTKVATDFFQPG